MKKVAFIIASKNYQEIEYEESKKVLEAAGVKVTTVSSKKEAKSKQGKTIIVDKLIDEVNEKDFDGLVFIGGGGCEEYFENQKALELLRQFDFLKKLIGAICLAPVILGRAGVITNKKVTCHLEAEELLKETGNESIGMDVVVDKHIITANGPGASREFGEALLKALE